MLTMNRPMDHRFAGSPSVDEQWFYAENGRQQGPVPLETLRTMASAGQLKPDDYVWTPGMVEWEQAGTIKGIYQKQRPPSPPPAPDPNRPTDADLLARKIAAGVCAMILGVFGVHKFILGLRGAGLTMLLLTVCSFGALSPLMFLIGFIEGIVYLAKSEDEFYRDYFVNRRGWF